MSPRLSIGVAAVAAVAALAVGRPTVAVGQDVARRPASPRQEVFGRVLASELKLKLQGVEGVAHRATIEGRAIEGRGPAVRLDGVQVTRLEFERAGDALYFLANVLRPGRSPQVGDARGRQLVVVSGARLGEPERAARVLAAAWADEVLPAQPRPAEALRVASPPLDEGANLGYDSVLLLGRGDTPAWGQSLEKMRRARAYSKEPVPGGPVVTFLSTNHFTFLVPPSEGSAGGWSEVAMTKEGALAAVAADAERGKTLVRWTRDLTARLPVPREDDADAVALRRRLLSMCDAVLGAERGPEEVAAPLGE